MAIGLTSAELKDLQSKARSFARARGHPNDADDFAQEVAIAMLRERKATLKQLLIDYLRGVYGATGTRRGRRRLSTVSLDAGEEGKSLGAKLSAPGAEPGSLGPDWRAVMDSVLFRGRDALIYEMRFQNEMTETEIADVFGVTESRICQIIKTRIEPKLEAAIIAHEAADLYHDDLEYSKLVVNWITL